MPGISFLGHLCGLLVGLAHVTQLLNWILPSLKTLRHIESSDGCTQHCSRVLRSSGYVLCPETDVVRQMSSGQAGLRAQLAQLVSCVWEAVRPLIDCCRALVARTRQYQPVPTSEQSEDYV